MAASPVVALALAVPLLHGLVAIQALALVGQAIVLRQRCGQPFLATLLSPLAFFLLPFVLLRSAALTLRQGGIRWRGTAYRMADIQAGRRIDL